MKRTPLPRLFRDRFQGRRDDTYREFIRSLPCALVVSSRHECEGPVECCHLPSRNTGAFDYGACYPGCRRAHQQEHDYGWRSVFDLHGVNLWEDAVRVFQRWLGTQ